MKEGLIQPGGQQALGLGQQGGQDMQPGQTDLSLMGSHHILAQTSPHQGNHKLSPPSPLKDSQ